MIDRSALLATFDAETRELLHILNDGFLRLEQAPGDSGTLAELFRAAHTIKGSARMLAIQPMADLAHHLEDVLDHLRAGRISVSPALLNVCFGAVDDLAFLLQLAVRGETLPPTPEARINQLRALLATLAPPTPVEPVAEPAAASLAEPAGEPMEAAAESRAAEPPPSPPPAAAPGSAAAAGSLPATIRGDPGQTIRVGVQKVDHILNLAGELLSRRSLDRQLVARMGDVLGQIEDCEEALRRQQGRGTAGASGHQADSLAARLADLRAALAGLTQQIQRSAGETVQITEDLQADIMQLRMLPFRTALRGLPRLVRDLCQQQGKEATLVVEGEEVAIDKKVIELLGDALLHLVRNAVDHGVEAPGEREAAGKPRQATIRISATQRGEVVLVTVADDGRGIAADLVRQTALRKGLLSPAQSAALDDAEILDLLFQPGFSTSPIITDTSGRGVGLDVVRTNVRELKGQTRIASAPGRGTTVTLELPVSLATTKALLVEAGGSAFALPVAAVNQVIEVEPGQVRTVQGRPAIALGGRTVPLASLADLLGLPARPAGGPRRWPAVVVGSDRPLALAVEAVRDEEDVVVKSLGPLLRRVRHFAGGTIRGDGEVVLVLNPAELVESARLAAPSQPASQTLDLQAPAPRAILVVDDSPTTREMERAILRSAGYDVEVAEHGAAALARLRKRAFDLVVADVEMPEMDGFSLTAAMRQDPRLQEVPVVIVSSRDREEDRRRGVEVGAQAYITKGGFDQASLLATIERLIG